MKKSKILGCVAVVAAALSLGACSAADTASRNISYDSDNFKVMRRVVSKLIEDDNKDWSVLV